MADVSNKNVQKILADSLVDPEKMKSILKTPDRPVRYPNAPAKGKKIGSDFGYGIGISGQEFANDLFPSTKPLSNEEIQNLLNRK